MKKLNFLLAAPLLAFALAGCSSTDVNNLEQDTKKFGQDLKPVVTGAALATKVNTAISLHKGINMSGLHIETEGSTVTVGGHVRDANEKHIVLDVVKNTTGVDKVVDKLNIQK